MRFKIFLIGAVLVLTLQAFSPVQLPASATDTPIINSESPTPNAIAVTPNAIATVGNTTIQTPPNLAVVSSPTLTHIAFLDASNGWGVANNDRGYILRTSDGGTTWVNATPQGLTGIGYSTILSVLDVNNAWVLMPNSDFFTGTLYRTMDGGGNWTSYDVPFGGGFVQFVDANTGRVMAVRGAAAGSQSVEIFQTSDGGATWLSVFNNDPTRPDSSNSLPFSGSKNGMTFLDADTGWISGERPMNGDVYLFVTHDGGIDWAQQNILLPAGYESYMYMPEAPVFYGSDGFLPMMIYLTNTTELTFYTTQDGGSTWTGDPANATKVINPGIFSFADAKHGWNWDGGSNLYFTTDGAQTWAGLLTSLDLSGRLSQMIFVLGPASHYTGWVLTGPDDTGHTQLFKTTDNGITWTALIP